MKVYIASSWRNARQPEVVRVLRAAGHEVYDFRNPAPGNVGFSWADAGIPCEGDPRTGAPFVNRKVTAAELARAHAHPVAVEGFRLDSSAVEACDVCVLVLPCGRSAHIEAGYAAGRGARLIVLMEQPDEPELMYAWGQVVGSLDELLELLDPMSAPNGWGAEIDARGLGKEWDFVSLRGDSRQAAIDEAVRYLRDGEIEGPREVRVGPVVLIQDVGAGLGDTDSLMERLSEVAGDDGWLGVDEDDYPDLRDAKAAADDLTRVIDQWLARHLATELWRVRVLEHLSISFDFDGAQTLDEVKPVIRAIQEPAAGGAS